MDRFPSTTRRLATGIVAAFSGGSAWTKASIFLFLAVPQLYFLPQGTSDISSTTVFTVLVLPGILLAVVRGPDRAVLRVGLLRVLAGLLGVRLLALLWSPDPRSGFQYVVLLGQFVIILTTMYEAVRRDADLLRHVQLLYWPWVVIEVFLVVLFRLVPAVEDAFLRSVGGLFAGQNTIAAFFGDSPNNVLDAAKSGGVFVNANVAAMFLGVNGLAALAASSVTRVRWVRVIGVTALAAVPFTGSKLATILAFALPAVGFGVHRMSRAPRRIVRRSLLIAGIPSGIAAVPVLFAARDGLLNPLAKAFVSRTIIWGFGAESFQRTPVLGLGYGGWDAGFKLYAAEHGLSRGFPPHNVLLATWSATGITGLTLTVVFFFLLLRLFIRGLSERTRCDKGFAIYAGAAVAWVVIQGMGENTDIFGEIHLMPILALLIAYLVQHTGEELNEIATDAHGRNRQAPTVPAVGDVHRQSGVGATRLPAAVRGEGPGPDHAGSRLG